MSMAEQIGAPRAEPLRQVLPKMASIIGEYGFKDQEMFKKLDPDEDSYKGDTKVGLQRVIVDISLCLSGIWVVATADDKAGAPILLISELSR